MATAARQNGGARRGGHHVWLVVVTFVVIHLVFWKASGSPNAPLVKLAKRANIFGDAPAPDEDSIIDYRRWYDSASSRAKPGVFVVLTLWLIFLFAFVGITASDFFCPNLSTIATRLGLSESVAGVTFLAFSNGSPDVFSTFAALKRHTGSLAIGELLGAASFIVSVVAGTMCLIQPFRVAKHTFLRDVGFFTVAVAFTLGILWDSHIHAWEAAFLVGLYCIYVAIVAIGTWWQNRKERRNALLKTVRSEYEEEYHDDPSSPTPLATAYSSTGTTPRPTTPGADHLSSYPFPKMHPHSHIRLDDDTITSMAERGMPVTLTRTRSGSIDTRAGKHRRVKSRSAVRPSLLGAIEFRDVVNSLQADSTARTLAVFGGSHDGQHTHATFIGSDLPDRGARGPRAQSRPGRAKSHTGAGAGPVPGSSDGSQTPLATPKPQHDRRATWTAEERARAERESSSESQAHWSDLYNSDDGSEGDEDPLVDLSSGVEDPWKAYHRQQVEMDLPPKKSSTASMRSLRSPGATGQRTVRKMPSIMLTDDVGAQSTVHDPQAPKGWLSFLDRRGYRIAQAVFLALFPSLQGLRDKSWVGRTTAILCAPAILLLNLTLPVVETEDDDCLSVEEKEQLAHSRSQSHASGAASEHDVREGVLVDTSPGDHHHDSLSEAERYQRHVRNEIAHEFHSHVTRHPTPLVIPDEPSPWQGPVVDDASASRPLPTAQRRIDSEATIQPPLVLVQAPVASPAATSTDLSAIEADLVTRYLTAVQCLLGPLFIVTALTLDDMKWWHTVIALGIGVVLASGAFYFFDSRAHKGRIVLCFVGFLVAMVWILVIVNEVVGVLQTFGHIFGLSDSIVGLTIFAMGNSLGDLVANATVARMGYPSMAIAACFGGPMLNILLGIGLSGTYMIARAGGEPYDVHVGRTLIVSGVGLLAILIATLIAVPLNSYRMDKKIGAALIVAYCCVLSVVIAVEVLL